MAWTTPSTWVAGNILTAAQLNQQLRDNMNELAPFMAAWTTWTPSAKQGATPTQNVTRAKYLKVGKLVFANFDIAITGAGTAGNAITLDYSGIGTSAAATASFGGFRHFDTGVTNYVGIAIGASTTTLQFYVDAYGANHGQQPVNFSNGDIFQGWFVTELA